MTLKNALLVQSPSSELSTNQGCSKVKVVIEGVEFLANLIIIDTKSLDMGIDWLANYQAILDCGGRSITLVCPVGTKVKFEASTEKLDGALVYNVKAVSLEYVPVVKEFPDVFPDE